MRGYNFGWQDEVCYGVGDLALDMAIKGRPTGLFVELLRYDTRLLFLSLRSYSHAPLM